MTKLIEFKNHQKEVLRGLIDEANSNIGAVLIHGFERTTIESKFKNIIDKLKGKINLFRFDFSGCGLSDGRFEDITTEKLLKELEKAITVFKKISPKVKTIILISHSFGCCVALRFITMGKEAIGKAVFLVPAFNQKELFKYWFAVSNNKKKKITWNNYKRYFSKKDFDKEMKKPKRMTKTHFISNSYVLENEDTDYQILFNDLEGDFKNMLIAHGDSDDKVPFESNHSLPESVKIIKIKGGDHDVEKMDSVTQYLDKVSQFILREKDIK